MQIWIMSSSIGNELLKAEQMHENILVIKNGNSMAISFQNYKTNAFTLSE